MKCPKYDFHIHTTYLGCANETMTVEAIIKECERLGVETLAITDHLNKLADLPHHAPIITDIKQFDTSIDIYFGVELNYTGCDEEFVYSEEIKKEHGFQFAIGGIHRTYLEKYDLKKIIDIQHRHHIKTCTDGIVDVLVHPYWFSKGEFDNNNWPWFESMKAVPQSYARQLGQVAAETGTAIEINGGACLNHPNLSDDYVKSYRDYLSVVAEEGAKFSLASDAHDVSRLSMINDAWNCAEWLGLTPERIWHPDCEPIKSGK